jgi:hypothetical protein
MRFLLPVLLLILAGCETIPTHTTVSTEPGPDAAALNAAHVAQITALKEQVANQEARYSEVTSLASKAAGNVHGILSAAAHIVEAPDLPAKDAIMAEGNLAQKSLPAPSPEVALEAERRINLLLTGKIDEAQAAYGTAMAEISKARAEIEAREAQIATQAKAIAERDMDVARLKIAAEVERQAAAAKIQAVIDQKEAAIQKLKDEQAAKERRLWVNVLRYGGLAFIALGILTIALTKGLMWQQGGLLFVGGAGTIGTGMAFDLLMSQKWFFPVFGGLVLVGVIGGGWALWRLWRNNLLAQKAAAMVDDIRTESKALGNSLWDQVEAHVKYRFGDKNSALGKELKAMSVAQGLSEDKP